MTMFIHKELPNPPASKLCLCAVMFGFSYSLGIVQKSQLLSACLTVKGVLHKKDGVLHCHRIKDKSTDKRGSPMHQKSGCTIRTLWTAI